MKCWVLPLLVVAFVVLGCDKKKKEAAVENDYLAMEDSAAANADEMGLESVEEEDLVENDSQTSAAEGSPEEVATPSKEDLLSESSPATHSSPEAKTKPTSVVKSAPPPVAKAAPAHVPAPAAKSAPAPREEMTRPAAQTRRAAPTPATSQNSTYQGSFSSRGQFAVQVALYKQKHAADALVAKLKGMSYPAYAVEVSDPTPSMPGTWYRVRVGSFAGRPQAVDFGENALVPMGYNYWVDANAGSAPTAAPAYVPPPASKPAPAYTPPAPAYSPPPAPPAPRPQAATPPPSAPPPAAPVAPPKGRPTISRPAPAAAPAEADEWDTPAQSLPADAADDDWGDAVDSVKK